MRARRGELYFCQHTLILLRETYRKIIEATYIFPLVFPPRYFLYISCQTTSLRSTMLSLVENFLRTKVYIEGFCLVSLDFSVTLFP